MFFSVNKKVIYIVFCFLVCTMVLTFYMTMNNSVFAVNSDLSDTESISDEDELTSDNFYDPFSKNETVYIGYNSETTDGLKIDNSVTSIPFTRTEEVGNISTLLINIDSNFLNENGFSVQEFLSYLCCSEDEILKAVQEIEDGKTYTLVFKIQTKYLTTQKPSSDSDAQPTDTDEIIIILQNYGDVNCDNRVTMEDVTSLQKIIAKLCTHEQFGEDSIINSDVNHDNYITMVDVTYIQKYIAKLIESF